MVEVVWTPRELAEWGALGGIVGRLAGDYWQVPVLVGIERAPKSDEMKHFGAALASFGSVALFHMAGITPEAMPHRRRRSVRHYAAVARGRRSSDVAPSRTRYAADARNGRCRGVLGSAAQPAGDARSRRNARWPARHHPAAGRDLAAGEARRRSHGHYRAHRRRRRHGPLRHVLLSELCAGDGGGERLAAAGDQLGEADQHPRRLRLHAGAAVDGGVRRRIACAGGKRER